MNKRKAQGGTDRIPAGFDLKTLSPENRQLHDEIVEEWNDVCSRHVSMGRKLVAMHKRLTENGAVKGGGPGSQWMGYLAVVGIPKSTAQGYMALAQKREQAGIPKKAEQYLTSVGVPLDKPRVVDALLTPGLKKKVAAVKCSKDAETLKPLIMESARNLPGTSRKEGAPKSGLPEQVRLRESCLAPLSRYLQTLPSEKKLHELSEICSDVLGYEVQLTIPETASKAA